MRRPTLSLSLAVGFILVAGQSALAANAFTTRVSPQAQTNATEPSVAVDRSDGTIYVAWQGSGTHVARSDDGGRSFVQTPINDPAGNDIDRKSTRLNSSHSQISYAVFCLKKKKT